MKTLVKKLLIATGLCAVAATASAAMNFAYLTQSQLVRAGAADYAATGFRTYVYLDYARLYDSGDGFGPSNSYYYFTCRNGRLALNCNSYGGYQYF
jgi:hypothetical protein